jgi:hypothetical protein
MNFRLPANEVMAFKYLQNIVSQHPVAHHLFIPVSY